MTVGQAYIPIIYMTPDCEPGQFWWNCNPIPVNFPGPKVWFHMDFIEAIYAGTAPNQGGSWDMTGDDNKPPATLTWHSHDDDRDYIWLLPSPPVMDGQLRLGIWAD